MDKFEPASGMPDVESVEIEHYIKQLKKELKSNFTLELERQFRKDAEKCQQQSEDMFAFA